MPHSASAAAQAYLRRRAKLCKVRRNANILANRVVKHARDNFYPKDLCCPDCEFCPIKPVTGKCGHTRCMSCIEQNGDCPCGERAPRVLHINVKIEDLIKKMFLNYNPAQSEESETNSDGESGQLSEQHVWKSLLPLNRKHTRTFSINLIDEGNRFPMPWKMRYNCIYELITRRRYREAVSHLAILATQIPKKNIPHIKSVIANIIRGLKGKPDPRRLTLRFYRSIRKKCPVKVLQESDMECIICVSTLRFPVTTPCGHTFCRLCLRRTINNTNCCALCRTPLHLDCLKDTAETKFIASALVSTGRKETLSNYFPDYIPVFLCSVSFPTLPYHLLLHKGPNSMNLMKWILEEGSRVFGILSGDPITNCIGTMVEVRDCIQLRDGNYICSTICLSRFRIVDLIRVDGCYLAEVEEYVDFMPHSGLVTYILKLSQFIIRKCLRWLTLLSPRTIMEIDYAYGPLPAVEGDFWLNPHGPRWLWWIIAIVPIKDSNKFREMMVASTDLVDRMFKVAKVLELLLEVNGVEDDPLDTLALVV